MPFLEGFIIQYPYFGRSNIRGSTVSCTCTCSGISQVKCGDLAIVCTYMYMYKHPYFLIVVTGGSTLAHSSDTGADAGLLSGKGTVQICANCTCTKMWWSWSWWWKLKADDNPHRLRVGRISLYKVSRFIQDLVDTLVCVHILLADNGPIWSTLLTIIIRDKGYHRGGSRGGEYRAHPPPFKPSSYLSGVVLYL